MQNEKYYLIYCNVFEYNHDFRKYCKKVTMHYRYLKF